MNFSSLVFKIGWGLDTSLTESYPFSLYILRSDSNNKYIPYNGLGFYFKLQEDIPTGLDFQLVIKVPGESSSMILPGSISHSLPITVSKKSRCYISGIMTPPDRIIICDNIDSLNKDTEYFIGFRMSLPYDEWANSIGGSFGTMLIRTKVSGKFQNYNLVREKKAFNIIQTLNNADWFIKAPPTDFDTTIVSSEDASVSLNIPNANILGINPSTTTTQRLIFTMNRVMPNGAVTADGAGIVIMTNPIFNYDELIPPVLEAQTTQPTQKLTFQKLVYGSSKYNKFSVSGKTDADLNGLFSSTTGVGVKYFAIKNIKIESYSSPYADDSLLDFYIAFYDKFNIATPALKEVLLFNGYTISMPKLPSIKYSIVNFWSHSSENNDGSKFPTFLRIAGFFTDPAELKGASQKLSIFFQNLIPFYENNDWEINNQVACNCIPVSVKCHYFTSNNLNKGQGYINYERVDVDFGTIPTTSSGKFQLIIPVKTSPIAAASKINIFLGTIVNNSYYQASGAGDIFYKYGGVYRLTGGNNIQNNNIQITPFAASLGNFNNK